MLFFQDVLPCILQIEYYTMKKQVQSAIVFAILFLTFIGVTTAQSGLNYWTYVDESSIPVTGTRLIRPLSYQTLMLDLASLKIGLSGVPVSDGSNLYDSDFLIEIPMPGGGFETFRLSETPMIEKPLEMLFPEIKTYSGVSISDGGKYLKMDVTPQGFHGMVLTVGQGTVFIDPLYFGNTNATGYILYNKKDFYQDVQKNFTCDVVSQIKDSISVFGGPKAFGTCQLRTYRLALAATGEYTTFHGGTVLLAQAAQVTTMNRVNGVFERDIAIRMNIVANNNLIVYTNAATDPYTNGTPGTMINQNQTTCDNIIGSANYDIGHVFGTNSGGLAGLGVVCTGGQKARGVTGSAAPIGDPFDIDYVAHEMGHQFGANHTQNNNCNRNNATAMEPGSASTIMGYAGICAPNVQSNSDDYFHGISLQEIHNEIMSAGHTCEAITTLSNSPPDITTTTTSYSIPANTPFALTVTATDPNTSNILTYCWEQMDNGAATMPPVSTSTVGPNFRSWNPDTSPTRYFPRLADLANNTVSIWEVLPSVSRTMNFRVIVRDNAPGGGCNDHHDVSLSVTSTAGPFVVTYPSATGITWNALSSQTITWNVANTNVSPVNCSNVDIFLSTDGGLTYPTILASNTPNDGSHLIFVPNTPSTTCRVMVRSANGVFFDISDNNFTITGPANDYQLSVINDTLSLCPPSAGVYSIQVGSTGGYTDPVTLSVTGVPAGAIATLGTNPVIPAGTSTLTIDPGTAIPGTYTLTLQGNSTTGIKTVSLTLVISSPAPGAATLLTPVQGATGVMLTPTLSWSAMAGGGITFSIQIATDPGFTNIVSSASGLISSSFVPTSPLASNTTYYWRVMAQNPCGIGPYSSVFNFTTATVLCTTFVSTNVPVSIPSSGTPTVFSNLTVPTIGTIMDVNVVNLVGTHTWINDLTIRVISPTATSVVLFDQICNNEDNFNVNFDDEATPAALPCPPVGGGTYQPAQLLSAFDGQALNGVWSLSIKDNYDQDGGSLTSWGLHVCYVVPPPPCLLTVSATPTHASCNLNNGQALASVTNATGPVTYSWSHGPSSALVTNLAAGSYQVIAVDSSGCMDTAFVSILQDPDNVLPIAVCQDVSIYLDVNGNAVLSPLWVDNGSTDNCGIASLSLSQTLFTCADLYVPFASGLFISEYIEGSSNNKCIEIANFTGSSVNLGAGGYQVRVYTNGSTTPTIINLTGTVAHGDVFVLCNPSATSGFLVQADQFSASLTFNGDDAVSLATSAGGNIDIIGMIGCDPGTQWVSGAHSTLNKTLRRNPNIYTGVSVNPPGPCNTSAFTTLATEWSVYAQDNNADLGVHAFSTAKQVSLTVTDSSSNTATCSANVFVYDNLPPSISPPADINTSPDPGFCTATGVVLGAPLTSDNCSGSIVVSNNAPPVFPTGATQVTWTATDASGNSTSAIQTVTVTDLLAPVPDVASLSNAAGECMVVLTPPTATDNCDGSIIATTTDPTTFNTIGSYNVVWTYTDSNGNTTTQTQNITVYDLTAPIPDLASLPVLSAPCTYTISSFPTATDNCDGVIIGSTTDPLTYNSPGTYIVIWTYTDGQGNTATQSQTIDVQVTALPVPDQAVLPVLNGSCALSITTTPTASPGCSGAGSIIGTTTDPLSYTSQGTYTVTWTYDDGFGNTVTQTQQVVVDDNTAPTPNVSMLPDIEGCNVIITTTPMATDDCDGNIIATTSDPLSYSTPGTYTVNWLFEDVSGNTTSQVQTVSVFDCSGIDEQAGIMQIVLFPNPTEGMITLQFSEMPEGDCHLRLINTLGQVIQVMMIQGPVVEMDLTMLPAATYYIQIVTQNGIKVEPIIVK